MKKLNVTMYYTSVGQSSIMVPDGLTREEAIKYANEHIKEIPCPRSGEYVDDSDSLDEENCDYDDGETIVKPKFPDLSKSDTDRIMDLFKDIFGK